MPTRSLRPLAYAVLTAVVSIGLLVLAIGNGWLGPDVGRGANFCEAARDGWVKQPANSFSNLGFVVAGLLVAWRAGRRDQLGDVLPTHAGLATAYACVVVVLGPASAAMHATQAERGGDFDLLSMYLVAAFAAAYALMRWYRQGQVLFAQLFLLFVAALRARRVVRRAGAGRGPGGQRRLRGAAADGGRAGGPAVAPGGALPGARAADRPALGSGLPRGDPGRLHHLERHQVHCGATRTP